MQRFEKSLHFLKTFPLESEKDTQLVACRLAAFLRPGDVLFLCGDLGAGKTTLARFIINALCKKEITVPSPTFPLVLTYESPSGPLFHADFYRLTPSETKNLGLEELFCEGISLVEWPENLGVTFKDPLQLSLDKDQANKKNEKTRHHEDNLIFRKLTLYGSDKWAHRLCDMNANEESLA